MIPTIFYTVLHIRRTFNERSSSDKNYLRRGASFSSRKSKVCTWHIIPKVTLLSLLHDERTRTPSPVPLFRPRSPRNGSFVAWLAAVNQYPHPPYGVTAIVIPSPWNVINAVVLPMHAVRNNVTSTDGVTVRVSTSTLDRRLDPGLNDQRTNFL